MGLGMLERSSISVVNGKKSVLDGVLSVYPVVGAKGYVDGKLLTEVSGGAVDRRGNSNPLGGDAEASELNDVENDNPGSKV
jgi:hypothetical protein